MNQSPEHNLNTVDAVVDDIISEMPLDDRVRTANLDEDALAVLQLALGKHIRYQLKNQSEDVTENLFKDCIKQSGNDSIYDAEAASYILTELWKRLQETHKLRAVKYKIESEFQISYHINTVGLLSLAFRIK